MTNDDYEPNDDPHGLRARITQLETQVRDLYMFQAIADHAPDAIGMSDLTGTIIYSNQAQKILSGYGEQINGMNFYVLYPKEDHPFIQEAAEEVMAVGNWQGRLHWQVASGHIIPIAVSVFAVPDPITSAPVGFASIVRDLSAEEQVVQERELLQTQVIAAQRETLRELSTPLIPLAAGVLALPLIGTIDSTRAQQMIETLLDGVSAAQAHTAIIDITGVPVVDTQVANALLQAAQAVKLLGTQVVLTGIRPEVAHTLVGLGVDMRHLVTASTLEKGIAYALQLEQ